MATILGQMPRLPPERPGPQHGGWGRSFTIGSRQCAMLCRLGTHSGPGDAARARRPRAIRPVVS